MTPGQAPRRGTTTSAFGSGKREGHDATAFYERFAAPELSTDDFVAKVRELGDPLVCGDARHMDAVADASVALVVTSPPYFAGKAYEQDLTAEGVPSSYVEYLDLLRGVFAECKRKLEPGGRIAVNVANLGRKPYRSLSADVTGILQDDLHLLLRGEVIWVKADGAGGNCAWGSFRQATNPVLRDLSERVVIASKGRFDRAQPTSERRANGLPWESEITNDEFMGATVDVWRMPPESATRVGHPAPFPVELPQRLIDLYTFRGDLVLDPFLGSGSTAVAAARRGRRFAGYDTDPAYIEIAKARLVADCDQENHDDLFRSCAVEDGRGAAALAEDVLVKAGFSIATRKQAIRGVGVTVMVATDQAGEEWYFDVTGGFASTKEGLRRNDTLWRSLGRASVLQQVIGTAGRRPPLVLLTSHLPPARSSGDRALHAVGRAGFHDAIEMLSEEGFARLARYAGGGFAVAPLPGFWTEAELGA